MPATLAVLVCMVTDAGEDAQLDLQARSLLARQASRGPLSGIDTGRCQKGQKFWRSWRLDAKARFRGVQTSSGLRVGLRTLILRKAECAGCALFMGFQSGCCRSADKDSCLAAFLGAECRCTWPRRCCLLELDLAAMYVAGLDVQVSARYVGRASLKSPSMLSLCTK